MVGPAFSFTPCFKSWTSSVAQIARTWPKNVRLPSFTVAPQYASVSTRATITMNRITLQPYQPPRRMPVSVLGTLEDQERDATVLGPRCLVVRAIDRLRLAVALRGQPLRIH